MRAIGWRKRFSSSPKRFDSRQGETDKVSRRLIQVARPYLDCGGDLDEYRKELSLASTAWNLSLFPPDLREQQIKQIRKTLDAQALEEEHRQLIVQHIRELVRRKERLFPGDRCTIARVEVLDEGGSVRVVVASMSDVPGPNLPDQE